MPLRSTVPDPLWNPIVLAWEAASAAVAGGADPSTAPPGEDQAHRVVQAMAELGEAGSAAAEAIAAAFPDRDDLSDALDELREAWESVQEHARQAVD